MNTFDYIRRAVTMHDIAERYGLQVNGVGFAVCPFHSEKTASLKVYPGGRGWHCFGCGAGGSVIDFVMLRFGVSNKEAISIINRDFALGIPIGRQASYRERETIRRRMSEAMLKAEHERNMRNAREAEYNRIMDNWVWADKVITALKPSSPNDVIYDIYKEAVNKKVIAEYKLDCMGGEAVG